MNDQSGESGYLTFVHRFSRTLHCVAHIKDEPPAPGQNLSWIFEWTGRPKPKHVNAYRQWMLVTNEILSNTWGRSILYATPKQTELWTFQPGEAPKLVKKLNIGIP